jgi:hypothetical protein
MLFLMNDVVLNLDTGSGLPSLEVRRFAAVSRKYVIRLGREAFAAAPRLQHTDPEKARRLALLIKSKAPEVNAALFVAPTDYCKPEMVLYRLAEINFDVIARLKTRQEAGVLDAVSADREVWKRLAA